LSFFEIARTVVAKTDRFVVVVALKQPAAGAEAAAPRKGFYVSVPDGIPFETDEAAVAHVLANHLGAFFDLAEVEVDAPKGNFQVINKCSLTGELLGRRIITATTKSCSSTTRLAWAGACPLRPIARVSKPFAIPRLSTSGSRR
jgi:hypothetical protein